MTTQALNPPFPIAKPKRTTRSYTLQEYLNKEAKSIYKHEFIDGKIIRMPYAKGPHNIISANISARLIQAIDDLETPYIVFSSDQKIYFPNLNEGVYADALTVCQAPIYWDDQKLLLTNPLLVVEVLSKSTSHYDRHGKFDKYKTLGSFKEYVLIRQDKCYAEVWYRERPGLWHETNISDPKGMLPLQSMGISISMEKIYKNVEF